MKKINLALLIKIFPLLVFAIILVSLTSLSIFLYKNFYQTIVNAQQIQVLKSEISLTKVDLNLYKKIIDNLDKRRNLTIEDLSLIKDPFQITEEKNILSELKR